MSTLWTYEFESLSNTLDKEIHDVLSGSNASSNYSTRFHMTEDLYHLMEDIQKAVGILSLDKNFLIDKNLIEKYGVDQICEEKNQANKALDLVIQAFFHYKAELNPHTIQSLYESEISERHNRAITRFVEAMKALNPMVQSAKTRISVFSDELGVSDRFTGFRNNLSRGSRDTFRLGNVSNWKDHSNVQGYNYVHRDELNADPNYTCNFSNRHPMPSTDDIRFAKKPQVSLDNNVDKEQSDAIPCCSVRHDALPQRSCDAKQCIVRKTQIKECPRLRAPQEWAGIPTKFPGNTEYNTAYEQQPAKPLKSAHNANPIPEYVVDGRSLSKPIYEMPETEYQTRYEWPDPRKLTTLIC